jgi:hypothetical protein
MSQPTESNTQDNDNPFLNFGLFHNLSALGFSPTHLLHERRGSTEGTMGVPHMDFFPSLTDLDKMGITSETHPLELQKNPLDLNSTKLEPPIRPRQMPTNLIPIISPPNPPRLPVVRQIPPQLPPKLPDEPKPLTPQQQMTNQIPPPKRKRDSQELSWSELEEEKEKHKSAEKKRRGEMNDLLQKLKALLPVKSSSRMTKKNILFQSIQYITRLKSVNTQLQKKMVTFVRRWEQKT